MNEKQMRRKKMAEITKQITSHLLSENPNGRKSLKPTRSLGATKDFRGSTPQEERQGNKVTRRFQEPITALTAEQLHAKIRGERIVREAKPQLKILQQREGGEQENDRQA